MKYLALMALPVLCGGCVWYGETRETIPGNNPVRVSEVVTMHQEGAGDGAILREIHGSGVRHHPTAEDIVWLKQAGVSDQVITAMINAPLGQVRPPQTIVRRTYYHDEAAENRALFGLGAALGYALGRPFHHRHYSGCGHRW